MDHGACIPQRVHTVVISVQHSEKVFLGELRQEVMSKVVKTVIPPQYLDDKTIFHINPCGQFIMGGPQVIVLQYLKGYIYIDILKLLGRRLILIFEHILFFDFL